MGLLQAGLVAKNINFTTAPQMIGMVGVRRSRAMPSTDNNELC